jgi:hypothetical protein
MGASLGGVREKFLEGGVRILLLRWCLNRGERFFKDLWSISNYLVLIS